jgi:hypothetical protein
VLQQQTQEEHKHISLLNDNFAINLITYFTINITSVHGEHNFGNKKYILCIIQIQVYNFEKQFGFKNLVYNHYVL